MEKKLKINPILSRKGGGVRVMKITGSSSNDWIYQHFRYSYINTALSLIYTPLHTHSDSQFPLVVS
jgi:hypothetical protein